MESTWRPITRDEFDELVAEQTAVLNRDQRAIFDSSRVEPRQAILRRSEKAGDEMVWIIAECEGYILYFDDVEWGWNWSPLSPDGRILKPGGSQDALIDLMPIQDEPASSSTSPPAATSE